MNRKAIIFNYVILMMMVMHALPTAAADHYDKIKNPGICAITIYKSRQCSYLYSNGTDLKKHIETSHREFLKVHYPKRYKELYGRKIFWHSEGTSDSSENSAHESEASLPSDLNICLEDGQEDQRIKTGYSPRKEAKGLKRKKNKNEPETFKCGQCGNCYKHDVSLKRHIKSVHTRYRD